MNRLEDSLLIWRHVCDSKLMANIQLILCVARFGFSESILTGPLRFFNKADLLKEKLESGVRFGKYVPNYGDRPNDVSAVIPCEVLEMFDPDLLLTCVAVQSWHNGSRVFSGVLEANEPSIGI